MEVESNYQKYKGTIENWRKQNQEHVNKYHRDKRAKAKQLKFEQDALDFIKKKLNLNCV